MKSKSYLDSLRKAFTELDVKLLCKLVRKSENDINIRDPSYGLQTPLMRLCHMHIDPSDRQTIANILVDRKVAVNIKDDIGRTALSHACIAERFDIISILSKISGIDPNLCDEEGNSPLMYAVKSRRSELVELFLGCFMGKTLDVDTANNKGIYPLVEAEYRCDSEICKVLVKKGKADTSKLEKIRLPRDVRSLRQPRSPTPEMLSVNARRRLTPSPCRTPNSRQDLSPLVVSTKFLLPDIVMPTSSASDPVTPEKCVPPLSDVQEANEEDHVDDSVKSEDGKHSISRSAFSFPDINSGRNVMSFSAVSPTSSNNQLAFKNMRNGSRPEISLPNLIEEEDQLSHFTKSSEDFPGTYLRRQESFSLPDLRTNMLVCKKEDNSYVTSWPRSNDNLNCVSKLQRSHNGVILPKLNLNFQMCSSIPLDNAKMRDGFKGAPSMSPFKVHTEYDIQLRKSIDVDRKKRESEMDVDISLNGAKVDSQ